jgi:threonine synthase
MLLHNLLHPTETVSFTDAVRRGIGSGGGLFFPAEITPFTDIDGLLALPFVERSIEIAFRLLGDEFSREEIQEILEDAFAFPAPLVPVGDRVATLELFHGPTLAFKDFGARFMARTLGVIRRKMADSAPLTILSATSGDTGAAVAHAFFGQPGVRVVMLYPQGKISELQKKLFCTLGGNIFPVAVEGDFDQCQALVKAGFADAELVTRYGLNSANSINFARLLAQTLYYFEAVAQVSVAQRKRLVISVPSGNFGNLTAGLLAQALGLPVGRWVVATNANDTVPRYRQTGRWEVLPTIATLSNAMDVSAPNNWPRVEALLARPAAPDLTATSISDGQTRTALRQLYTEYTYLSEPHGAVAWAALAATLQPQETGIFLGTAHPAKFQESVESILGIDVPLPPALAVVADLPILSAHLPADFAALKGLLGEVLG